jgi:hypothetical protein
MGTGAILQCEADSECPLEFICVGGQCVEGQRDIDFNTGPFTPAPSPIVASSVAPGTGDSCNADSDCPDGFTCDPIRFICVSTGDDRPTSGTGTGTTTRGPDSIVSVDVRALATNGSNIPQAFIGNTRSTTISLDLSLRSSYDVPITAISGSDEYRFSQWIDQNNNPISINRTATFTVSDINVRSIVLTALFFYEPRYTITIAPSPLQGGEVDFIGLSTFTVSPDGSIYTASVLANNNNTVGITARAQPGYQFVRWEGAAVSNQTSPSTNITVTQNTNLVAIFEPVITPTPTPSVTPDSFITPTPTPTSSRPAISPTPRVPWRLCGNGELQDGNPPSNYRNVQYTGPGGGTCWEPITNIGFIPELGNLQYTYRRGSSAFPDSYQYEVENKSYGVSYNIAFETNFTYFDVQPRQISLAPRDKKSFAVTIRRDKIGEFADGQTDFTFNVNVTEV